MALAKMKRLYVLGKLLHREAVLQRLQELGFFEVESGAHPAEGWSFKQRKEKEAELERELSDLNSALAMMERFHRRKPTFIQQFSGIKTGMTNDEYQNYLAREEEAASVIDSCRRLETEWTKLENTLSALTERIHELAPWLKLDIPLSALGPQGSTTSLLVKVSPKKLGALEEAFAEIETPGVYRETVNTQKDAVYLFLLFRKELEEEVTQILGDQGGQPVDLGKEEQTPEEVFKSAQTEKSRLLAERDDLAKCIAVLVKERPLLQALHDARLNQLEQTRLVGELPCSDRTFFLDGWVMAKDLPRLTKALEDIDPVIYLETRDPLPDENVPVDFANHPLIRPFEVVVQVYGYPRYGQLDPTPALAPFFFVFFGITTADVGYGLFLSALCWYLLRTVKMAGMGKKLFEMLFLGGLSSTVFGILMGGYFSDLIPIPAIWFNPSLDPNRLLMVSLVLGAIQLYLGILIKAYMRIREKQWGEAFRNEGLWLIFITSLFLVLGGSAAGLGQYQGFFTNFAIGAAVAVIIGKSLGGGSLFENLKRLPGGIYTLYDAVSFFSDLLSYSRLLALGLSSAIIGQVVNFFVRMFNPGITNPIGLLAGLAIFAFGHLLNLLLAVLSAYVHSSRLQYIEFFNKFYEAGGRPFRPFTKKYNYVELDEKGEA